MSRADFFDERIQRIFEVCKVSKDAALARILDIRPQSIAAARKRRQIPFGWIEAIVEKFDVSADWLLFGHGSKRIKNDSFLASTPETHSLDWKQFQACENCAMLMKMLEQERDMNRELVTENRKLNAEGRQLLRTEINLRVALAQLQAGREAEILPADGNGQENA